MDILKVILTTLFSVLVLFILTKIMGHKQVGQLDFFDYINGITIGSIAAEMATELEDPWKPLIAMVIYGGVSVILSVITNKFPRTRKYINGTPTILMSDGKLYRKNIKKAKLDLTEFLLLCREQGYFDLADIQCAVLETNGKLTVLPTSESRPLTPKDMNIQPKKAHLCTELIMDGRILRGNLNRMKKKDEWLKNRLSQEGFGDISQIFLCVYSEERDKLSVYLNQ